MEPQAERSLFVEILSWVFAYWFMWYSLGPTPFHIIPMIKLDGIYEWLFCNTRCPVPGCSLPIDVVLCIKDSQSYFAKRFGTHERNLEVFKTARSIYLDTSSFPTIPGFPGCNRKIQHASFRAIDIFESPKILELLLRFSHSGCVLPDLRLENISVVHNFSFLAEACHDKPAQQACKLAIEYLGRSSPMNAFIALGYKSRKRQPIGIDEYARHSMSIPFADAVETRSRNDIFNKYHVCAVVWGRYRKAWNHIILRYIHTLQNLTNFDSVFENKDDIPAVLQLVRTKLESEVTFTPESVRRTFDIIREFGRSGALEKMVDLDSAQRVLEGILEQCPDWLEVETNYQYGG